MIKRVKNKRTGPYNYEEKNDIGMVTGLLITKAYSRDPKLTSLERDYVWFCRKTIWSSTALPLLTGLITFVFIDWLPFISMCHFYVRWPIKLGSLLTFWSLGASEANKRILEFPLIETVTVNGLLKYKEWIDVTPKD
ncbi:unnamed protein product [Blepharisma stoltei]|uniref:Uncharacterized protein n=1 Tax=Blepharisma stoltei TaxID=1481888 RepID=A0AAU9K6T5_9CILI|nr:unnamed protein product [Blepharisma stoltei]